jgi:hypothetical protein
MDSAADGAHYLAEWYLPELTDQSVDDIVAKLDVAASTVSDEGTPVRLLVTLAVPTDEVLYGVFGAQSPDIVTATCQRAGVPHQRLSGHVGTRIREGPHTKIIGEGCIRGLPVSETGYLSANSRLSAYLGSGDVCHCLVAVM